MSKHICALCNEVEVEMEFDVLGQFIPTSSFCNGCYFDVLVFRNHEMWIFEDDMIAMGYNYQTVPIQVINPFDSHWEDSDYADEMKESQEGFPHLEKYKDRLDYHNWEVDSETKEELK